MVSRTQDESMTKLISVAALAAALASPCAAAAQESAQVAQGKALYGQFCTQCHGADGKRGEGYQTPIWGPGSLIAKFETAQGLFEYHQMLMPFNDPSLMTDEQKWAVVAYVLANHGAIKPADTLSPANAPSIAIKAPQAAAPAPGSAPAQTTVAAATAPMLDNSAGERSWAKCRACHQVGPTARNGVGPHLNGLFGRVAGSVEGYAYSPANKASGLSWDNASFARYIQDPRGAMPGTKMVFAGIKNEQEIRDLAAFLKQYAADGKQGQ
jgi:cytochrome c